MLDGELFISSVSILWELVHGDEYLRRISALASLGERPLAFDSNVTFFVGENGSGKSTLLEAMAVAYGLNAEEALPTTRSPRGIPIPSSMRASTWSGGAWRRAAASS